MHKVSGSIISNTRGWGGEQGVLIITVLRTVENSVTGGSPGLHQFKNL